MMNNWSLREWRGAEGVRGAGAMQSSSPSSPVLTCVVLPFAAGWLSLTPGMWPELKARRSSLLKSKEIRCPFPKPASANWVAGCPRRILRKRSMPDFQGA